MNSVYTVLWIGFQRPIEFLNLETNSELDLKKSGYQRIAQSEKN